MQIEQPCLAVVASLRLALTAQRLAQARANQQLDFEKPIAPEKNFE
jgi:hypothetical protein